MAYRIPFLGARLLLLGRPKLPVVAEGAEFTAGSRLTALQVSAVFLPPAARDVMAALQVAIVRIRVAIPSVCTSNESRAR